MKRPGFLCALALLCFAAVTSPAAAQQDIYDNGPINGNQEAFTINFGNAVSDSFTVSGGTQTITGLTFGAWIFPGDVLESVDLSLSSQAMGGGTVYFDGTVNFTQSDNCLANSFGFDVCTETGSFSGVNLNSGTYWLTLQNAVVSTGDPVFWDQNNGVGCSSPGCPSQAQQTSIGTIPSEAFTLTGDRGTTSTTGTTPEPSTLTLLGGGVLAAIGALRNKLS